MESVEEGKVQQDCATPAKVALGHSGINCCIGRQIKGIEEGSIQVQR